jgi:hypothetical protein
MSIRGVLTHSNWRFAFYLFFIILVWWLSPYALRLCIRNNLQELQAPLWYSFDCIHQMGSYWQLRSLPKENLIREIVKLSRSLSYCELLLSADLPPSDHPSHDDVKNHSERLQRFSSQLSRFNPVLIRVLRRDEKAWWQEIVISGGRNDGITENMAIIGSRGLIGKTYRVFSRHSIALLATDPRFRIVAHIKGDLRPIVFEGAFQKGFNTPIGRVTHVPLDVKISQENPLMVVASSLSGVYPEGLPMGTIKTLKESVNGAFQEGVVHLNPQILSVHEALILSPKEELDPLILKEFQSQ